MRPTFAATATAVTLALLVTACGAPAAAPAPATTTAPPASAPASPPAVQPSAAAVTELTVEEFLDKFGKAQQEVRTYAMEMSMTSQEAGVIEATGVVDQSGGSFAQHMKMTTMGMEMEVIQADGAFYMLVPALGKDWIKMTAEQAGQQGVDMPAGPQEMLADAKDSFKKIEFIGIEEVAGVQTEHYRLTLADDAVEGEEDTAVSGYDVWLDDIGFTRKIVVEVKAAGSGFTTEVLTDKLNEPVSIKAPEKWVEMPS